MIAICFQKLLFSFVAALISIPIISSASEVDHKTPLTVRAVDGKAIVSGSSVEKWFNVHEVLLDRFKPFQLSDRSHGEVLDSTRIDLVSEKLTFVLFHIQTASEFIQSTKFFEGLVVVDKSGNVSKLSEGWRDDGCGNKRINSFTAESLKRIGGQKLILLTTLYDKNECASDARSDLVADESTEIQILNVMDNFKVVYDESFQPSVRKYGLKGDSKHPVALTTTEVKITSSDSETEDYLNRGNTKVEAQGSINMKFISNSLIWDPKKKLLVLKK